MSSSSLPNTFSQLPPPPPPSDQLCYVHCNMCNTVLAVSVPSASLFRRVAVRCGHCANLLPVNVCGGVNQFHTAAHSAAFFSPHAHNFLEEISNQNPINPNPNPDFLINQTDGIDLTMATGVINDVPRQPPSINRPPEKRQRVPSAYNRFIKDEIQRIKAANPDISHREAFSAAAKNTAKRTNMLEQKVDVMLKDR